MEQYDLIIGLIYLMVEEENPFLINLLQKSGSLVTNQSTPNELLDASLKALKDSASFRKNLSSYLVKEADSYSNYMNEDFFNQTGKTKYDRVTGLGGSRAGGLLRTVFSKENVSTLVSAGIGAAATKLQDSASKKGNNQAIEFAKAQSEASARELDLLKAKEDSPASPTANQKPKWVLPVAIGGGLLVVSLIVFFATRKK